MLGLSGEQDRPERGRARRRKVDSFPPPFELLSFAILVYTARQQYGVPFWEFCIGFWLVLGLTALVLSDLLLGLMLRSKERYRYLGK